MADRDSPEGKPVVPRDPPSERGVPVSFRIPSHLVEWLGHQAQVRGTSMSAIVRECLTDVVDWYLVSNDMKELLEQDRAERGETFRAYVRNLLSRRYTEIVTGTQPVTGRHKPPT